MQHWGNVDTGAQVNIAYGGVLERHPSLYAFYTPHPFQVQGVGGRRVEVTGKLVDVPVSMGGG